MQKKKIIIIIQGTILILGKEFKCAFASTVNVMIYEKIMKIHFKQV